ncbi:helix-turn-helix domain-containing protein [Vibrio sp. CAU 1672]|uniref:AraC family transcriptional regulator n=1 Tax=Vibrio sp. CAU 1672 TaxID=3032594 RepID=UPI0023DC2F2D|nr:helix-turn-helix domain-containing protein [Vibrio sp. CAU 1672]MDF2156058.1 helix-turn-helix domain-containing protein [Vibrio sp. CAU 1672]
MITKMLRPAAPLSDYIAQFWLWQCDSPLAIPDIFPGTGVEMLFNFGDPVMIESPQLGRLETYQGLLICPRKTLFRLRATGKTKIVSVRFRSAGFYRLFAIPLTEIADRIVDTRDIILPDGIHSLAFAETDTAMLAVIERLMLERLNANTHLLSGMEWAIDQIYYRRCPNIIRDVKQNLGVSERTFQRKFKMITGSNAKYFERTARFQSCLRSLLDEPVADYKDTIYMNGYYDQSHFIKDFNAFTGVTPGKFLTEENYKLNHYTHAFYNNRLQCQGSTFSQGAAGHNLIA